MSGDTDREVHEARLDADRKVHEARLDADWLGADERWPTFSLAGVPTHCGTPMRLRRCSNRWEGPSDVGTASQHVDWFCRCGVTVELVLRAPE